MSTGIPTSAPPSPLDPFVRQFLQAVAQLDHGYAPVASVPKVAEFCDCEPEFLEVLFASARIRGFLEIFQPKGARGRNRWRVSAKGHEWLTTAIQPPTSITSNGLHPPTS